MNPITNKELWLLVLSMSLAGSAALLLGHPTLAFASAGIVDACLAVGGFQWAINKIRG